MRNSLLGDTEQWKSRGVLFFTTAFLDTVLCPQCPCSAYWGTGRARCEQCIACSSQLSEFVLHHAKSPSIHKTLQGGQVCSDAEGAPSPSALPEPEEQRGDLCG